MRTVRWSSLAAAIVFLAQSQGLAGGLAGIPNSRFFSELGGIRTMVLDRIQAELPEDRAHRAVLRYLEGSGVPRSFVDAAFADARVGIEQGVVDRFKPRDPSQRPPEQGGYDRYRRIFITPKRIRGGAEFYASNKALVDEVAARYGVDPMILVSIPGVETFYGSYTGKYTVFNAYYTIIHKVPRRSTWATKQLAAFLRYAYQDGVDPHSIKGSYAGAFGYFQFIPTSFLAYAVDYDGDGVRNPRQWPDVLASIANYLVENGYRPGETDYSSAGSIWRAIYAYNHSDNYVKVVLELRSEILKALSEGTS